MKDKMTIIDVRTPMEFTGGNVSGSINIPLDEIETRVEEIKQMQQPIVLCCASGNRSGYATSYLKSLGIECENGGSWFEVNFLVNNLNN
ncbi:MAG TPA: rhodanese-like domain-containing protein [Saprospiraceae bacterium]|jgi:rhodanese-related sulfurtransferase|nr:rhodanese-like domain-containing protein [Saprospiraceae bacterium]MBX7179076.1 rhodanese-like domain-containing protein [Saprospiraceae bacterium]MCB0590147.1 rhodanese-like domain-containing protein [Saprospiraceae bacterium]MCC7147633.1 rhodanese-like domain-containing protein [Saprospiraceae bacterium]MCO5284078.1 rhodanese-like domain-containing protein [Saprospiraceae bacterium]